LGGGVGRRGKVKERKAGTKEEDEEASGKRKGCYQIEV